MERDESTRSNEGAIKLVVLLDAFVGMIAIDHEEIELIAREPVLNTAEDEGIM